MTTSVWQVSGMTCGHCVSAVRQGVGELDGVDTVEVVLETGEVTVTGDAAPDRSTMAAAVDDAGYQLVSRSRRAPDPTRGPRRRTRRSVEPGRG